jgi:hypothetical protein
VPLAKINATTAAAAKNATGTLGRESLANVTARFNRTFANMTAAAGSAVDALRHPVETARGLNIPGLGALGTGGKNATGNASANATAAPKNGTSLRARAANATAALRARVNGTLYDARHPVAAVKDRYNLTTLSPLAAARARLDLTGPVSRLEARLANVTGVDGVELGKVRDLVKVVNSSVATKISDTWDALQARRVPLATILKVVRRGGRAGSVRMAGFGERRAAADLWRSHGKQGPVVHAADPCPCPPRPPCSGPRQLSLLVSLSG